MPEEMKSTRDAYGEILEELASDPRIVVLDADTSTSTRTVKFAKKSPERFFNVGCAEQNLLATAAGLAYSGKIVIASAYAIFTTGRAWEQIRSFIAHDKLSVKIITTHAGLTNAADGASHHALEDIALMRSIPNIIIVVPADAEETKQAVRAAIEFHGPCYIRLSKAESPIIFGSDHQFKIGQGVILKEGSDVAIFACGNMVAKSLKASEILKERGISATVVNISTIKPIDEQLISEIATKTGAVVTVEEHSIYGGLGGAVAEVLCRKAPVPIEFVGVPDRFGESGTVDDLYRLFGLTEENIVKAAEKAQTRR